MSKTPWLTIIGIGEDGVEGLTAPSQVALINAAIIIGPPRHLAMIPKNQAQHMEWPSPFSKGIEILSALRGQSVVVLTSGDPFWFGAGTIIAQRFDDAEWNALPALSCFSLAAAQTGWALDKTICIGLHAAPFTRLRRNLAQGVKIIATLRDGDAVPELAKYLKSRGFGKSQLTIMERLGSRAEKLTSGSAENIDGTFEHPVCVAICVAGDGPALTSATGLPDDTFVHDNQITKRPIRAITISSLAPLPNQNLLDIGGGSGSVSIEWLLAHPSTQATVVEKRRDRAERILQNAEVLGVADRMTIIEGPAPDALVGVESPDAIFVGGGLAPELLDVVTDMSASRLVVNAVTLEGESLLVEYHAKHGGELMRIELAESRPLGPKRGWAASFPIVQWSLLK